MNLYFDEDKHQWIVTYMCKWWDENHDVMDFSQVAVYTFDINKDKREIYRETSTESARATTRRVTSTRMTSTW